MLRHIRFPLCVYCPVVIVMFPGGTDIIACFMGNNWTVPVYKGEIQCLFLGCDMQSWDDTGEGSEV